MKALIPLSISLLSLSASTAFSAVLYSSNTDFTVAADSNLSPTGVRWNGIAGRNKSGSNFYSIVETTGTPANNGTSRKAGVRNGVVDALEDYLFFENTDAGSADIDYFVSTATGSTFASFAPQDYTSLTASWLVSRSTSTTQAGYYVTVQVGGIWYSSTTNAASSETGGVATVNLLTSSWVTININPTAGTSGSLGRGTTTSTYANLFGAGQSITGFGFYVDDLSVSSTASRTLRIDNITIDGVIPEPSVALSGLLGTRFLFLRRRR